MMAEVRESAYQAHRSDGSADIHDGRSVDRASDDDDAGQPTSTTGRKKRKSRKGLSKRFKCTEEGCGKTYSRAEHLYRHQLNHTSKEVFSCQYPECPRTFVRVDLLKRHMDRHATRGNHLLRSNPPTNGAEHVPLATGSSPPSATQHQLSGSANHQYQAQSHYLSPQDPSQSPYSPAGNSPPGRRQYSTSSGVTTFSQHAGVLKTPPGSGHSPHFSSHGFAPTSLHYSNSYNPNQHVNTAYNPTSHYPTTDTAVQQDKMTNAFGTGPASEYSPNTAQRSADMLRFDHMGMTGAGTVFGDDGGLGKSPYVGLPEDFMAYLFSHQPNQLSPTGAPFQLPISNYGDLQDSHYFATYLGNEMNVMNNFPTPPQHIMSVHSLLDESLPETTISEERSQDIFDFIKDRFRENDVPVSERRRDSIVEGDRDNEEHMLSRRMMQVYLGSYWHHFSDQLPILHRPTFSSDKTPTLLLLAMMTIGAACLDRTHSHQVLTAGAKMSSFLARHIRWEVFMDSSFRPPAKLWVFQTLILLELYEKMFSTRELHERAHIHHATTVTLMRRGRSLMGKSSAESPPNHKALPTDQTSGTSSSSAQTQTADEWWEQWITNEATRRAAFAAFIIDSTHAAMFRHSAVMVTHEMRLPMPCDESLWRARSSAEVGRAEAKLRAQGIRPMSFLEGLKRTLSHQEVRTTSFGRTALMAGLMSVTYHMAQRDLQANILGGGVTQSLGGRDKWRATLMRAYDTWMKDYDKALDEAELTNDPYGQRDNRNESNFVFGSRTVLHHLAHMSMHADIMDCQMFARAKRLLGRTIGPQEFSSAQKRVKEQWAPSAQARDAAFYALKFLGSVLLPDRTAMLDSGSHGPYETKYDVLINRPWVLYFAALVVWCYGFALEGPCAEAYDPGEDTQSHMHRYLLRFGSITDPNELRSIRGVNENTALLKTLKESFEQTRWDLLHEGANLMHNCIVLNNGGSV